MKFLELDQSEHVSRRVVVATEQNVLAMLNARNAQIGMLYQYAYGNISYNVVVQSANHIHNGDMDNVLFLFMYIASRRHHASM